jgi:hypothetical protein
VLSLDHIPSLDGLIFSYQVTRAGTPLLGPRLSYVAYHVLNWITLGSTSVCLDGLWEAQGLPEMHIRRDSRLPRRPWERYFDLKKEEWRATGIMVQAICVWQGYSIY